MPPRRNGLPPEVLVNRYMPRITINNKSYPFTVDDWGILYIDGLTLDEFNEKLIIEDPVGHIEMVKKGAQLLVDSPEVFQDIVDRHEIRTDGII